MLITTIDEVKLYIESTRSISMETLMPSIVQAERRYLIPNLSQAQYDALALEYQQAIDFANGMPDDTEEEKAEKAQAQATPAIIIDDAPTKKLLALAQEVVANIAFMLVIPRLSVNVGDAGIQRSETNSFKTAFMYQETNLQDSYARAGYDAIEDMLMLMEGDIENYVPWATSDAYTEQKRYFISNAATFSDYFQIDRARLTYMCVRYIMQRVENFQLQKVIGRTLFAVLKDGSRNNTLSDAYKALLTDFIYPAIALHTIAKALIERSIVVSDKGVTVSFLVVDHNRPSREPAPDTKTQAMIDQLVADGDEYLSRLGDELASDAVKYPDFTSQVMENRFYSVDNKQENSFYGM